MSLASVPTWSIAVLKWQKSTAVLATKLQRAGFDSEPWLPIHTMVIV